MILLWKYCWNIVSMWCPIFLEIPIKLLVELVLCRSNNRRLLLLNVGMLVYLVGLLFLLTDARRDKLRFLLLLWVLVCTQRCVCMASRKILKSLELIGASKLRNWVVLGLIQLLFTVRIRSRISTNRVYFLFELVNLFVTLAPYVILSTINVLLGRLAHLWYEFRRWNKLLSHL